MGQTKRKRRTKHRGTAAGTIETRGRTGKHSAAANAAKAGGARGARKIGPPTWSKALAKSFFGAVLLFALMRFGILDNLLGGDSTASTADALYLSGLAVLFYTPIMYMTDRMQYQRYLRRNPGA